MLIRVDYVDGGHHSWPLQSMDRHTDINLYILTRHHGWYDSTSCCNSQ